MEQLQSKFQNSNETLTNATKNLISPREKSKFGFTTSDNKKEEMEDFIKFNVLLSFSLIYSTNKRQKLQEDRKKAIENELKEINRIKDQISLNKQSLERIESEIFNERNRKAHIVLKLKDLYMLKLNDG